MTELQKVYNEMRKKDIYILEKYFLKNRNIDSIYNKECDKLGIKETNLRLIYIRSMRALDNLAETLEKNQELETTKEEIKNFTINRISLL